MNRIQSIIAFLRNNRLKDYAAILQLARQKGYQLISVRDYATGNYQTQAPFMILRHDVDRVAPGTKPMVGIEQQFGARASYYFRNSSLDIELMQQIEACGSEASFHYETLSDYALKHNITTLAQLQTAPWQNDCLKQLEDDLNSLRKQGLPCLTIAGHGHKICHQLGVPNYAIASLPGAYQQLGIKLEGYNRKFITDMQAYICDDELHNNNGWRYGNTPQQEIASGKVRLLLLTHPNHWLFNFGFMSRAIGRVILHGPKNVPSKFSLD